ncbi:hypothetical protein ACA910_001466 [Epithemia clementina (nom. ined.)]
MGFFCYTCKKKVRGQPVKHRCTRKKYGKRANSRIYDGSGQHGHRLPPKARGLICFEFRDWGECPYGPKCIYSHQTKKKNTSLQEQEVVDEEEHALFCRPATMNDCSEEANNSSSSCLDYIKEEGEHGADESNLLLALLDQNQHATAMDSLAAAMDSMAIKRQQQQQNNGDENQIDLLMQGQSSSNSLL